MEKEIKRITKEQFNDFFDNFCGSFISVYISFEGNYSVDFPLYIEEEVLKYWHDKGYYRFSNLTLRFIK